MYNFNLRIFFNQSEENRLVLIGWKFVCKQKSRFKLRNLKLQIHTYRHLLILAVMFVDTFFNIDHIRFDKNVIFEQEKYETNQNTTCKNDNNNHLPIINIARFCKFLFLVRCKIWRCTRLFTVSTGTRSQT